MKKIISFLTIFLLFILLFASKTYAASNFSTDYDINYKVFENENTHVEINITLTNQTSTFYASSYKIQAGFSDIQNVKAFDSDGNILGSVYKDNEEQTIEVNFNKRVTGIGNKLNFNISFDTKEVAQKLGNIWEINMPGFSPKSNYSSLNAQVTVPPSFGRPAYVKPQIKDLAQKGNTYFFTKEQLEKSGISMAFGESQIYKFNLTYHLQNKNLFPIRTEIALPPNTNYQDVQIENIDPRPANVRVDNDGNWLAEYSLPPGKKTDVEARGKIKISLSPKKEPKTDNELSKYLEPNTYWEADNDKIKKLAQSLKTPRAIYDYVSGYLKYDYSRVSSNKPRLGALNLMDDPSSAVCLEFTDLFIALSRAAGIPAREIDGYAYTQDSKKRPLSLIKDILHAWPQYYDKDLKTWVMVDPTWANTTGGIDYFDVLDFDHIAFVIKGEDSNYPVPAGGYKLAGNEGLKDVNVSFANVYEEENPTLQIVQNMPNNIVSGFPFSGSLLIKNAGKTLAPAQSIIIYTSVLAPHYQRLTISEIPPYGNLIIPITFSKTSFLTNRQDLIRISLGGNTLFHKVKIIPIFLSKWALLGGGVIAFGILIISIIVLKPWNLPIFRSKG
ncbi:MAG: hypothetical protein A2860_02085 [Candidatus Levybacteria bacterium RIFCSPHIGHO2_01_FULL_37_33]|nr:MAG: hypothetical protein A2860_02085 [Candidatus Levybacteria bacterium RIFCSPHIGHO2_01_FULL_37_33]OGH32655.1 MAG: hypothetical protein A2953_01345 [Candidatus Levybacteria bacterium RIFCSPLOWO2_01_FULL_36_54]